MARQKLSDLDVQHIDRALDQMQKELRTISGWLVSERQFGYTHRGMAAMTRASLWLAKARRHMELER